MDPEQIRIQSDLRGLLSGDVYCDPLYLQMYASDASVYEIQPLGVVRPRNSRDVSELLKYCTENHLNVYPRGGGSGLAGQSLGRGIILDLSRYMRRVDAPQADSVRVQCGIVQADLNRSIGKYNRLFGPDPATRSVSSIGSMLAIDAAGSHFPQYGSTGDCVESVEVVLPSGELVELNQHDWADERAADSLAGRLARDVGLLLQQASALLMRPPWGDVSRGCGYRVEKVLDGDRVNLARLMCGAEGTLGVITEATLRVQAIPKVRGLMLVFFSRLESAAKAAVDLTGRNVGACDLMDRRLLEIARETEPVYETIIPRGAEAMLLVEIQGEDPTSVRTQLNQILHRQQRKNRSVIAYRLTTDREERNLLWRLARRVIPRLYRLKGSMRPLPFVEDIAIPPSRLPEFLRVLQDVLKSERVTATLFAHALQGQVDIRPFLDLASPKDQVKLARLSELIYEQVLQFDGCISGEHALGLSRAGWAERQLGPRLELFRRVKRVFDPDGILNAGKFLSPTPPKVNENLRPVPQFDAVVASFSAGVDTGTNETPETEPEITPEPSPPSPGTLPIILDWPDNSLSYTARSCNGCGRCRTSAQAERMCPVFRVHKGEEASPRAKANLLRGVLTGSLDATDFESRDMKGISDLCFNCHQCRLECPASVNIPKLVLEAKAQHVASHGLSIRDRLLNRLDLLAYWASRMPRISNWSLSNPFMRWLLEKIFGIGQSRKLPKVSRRSFLSWASRAKLGRTSRGASLGKVAYFADQYVNQHNPLLGRALVEVLQHQNIEVYVPPNQTPSYAAMISSGEIAQARKLIRTNVETLAEAVRQGYDIVTSEPSAALCLQQEYPSLLPGEETELIAANCYEVSSYLWRLHGRGQLELDFRPTPMEVVYHQPCHTRVLDQKEPALQLLRLVPGLQVSRAAAGCSGMAGTFGLKRQNYWTSVRIGRGLINTMKNSVAQVGATECTSCKVQMEQGTSKPTLHPIAILAYAYGILPDELGSWIGSRSEPRVLS